MQERPIDAVEGRKLENETYIVASTLSIVRPPCICFMALPAFFMAFSVS